MFSVSRSLLLILPFFRWGPLSSTAPLPLTSTSPSSSSHHFLGEALPADGRSQVWEAAAGEEPCTASCQPQGVVAVPLVFQVAAGGTNRPMGGREGRECFCWYFASKQSKHSLESIYTLMLFSVPFFFHAHTRLCLVLYMNEHLLRTLFVFCCIETSMLFFFFFFIVTLLDLQISGPFFVRTFWTMLFK